MDVVVIGDAVPDLVVCLQEVPSPGQGVFAPPPRTLFGGAGANVAAALARLGVRVGFVGRVGQDDAGQQVRADLAACGVNSGGLVEDPDHATGGVIALVDAGGERTMIGCVLGSAYHQLSPADLRWQPIEEATIVQVSGLLMLEEPSRSAALTAIHSAVARGATVHYDPNLRVTSGGLPREQAAAHWEAMIQAHAVTATEAELAQLGAARVGAAPPAMPAAVQTTARRLLKASADSHGKLLVVKQGAGGATAFSAHLPTISVFAYPVSVVDTIGAGDVFDAAFIAALLRGDPLADALDFANAAAALSTTVAGGRSAPTLQQIAALRAQYKRSGGASETDSEDLP